MEKYQYPGYDPEGLATLDAIARADNFNSWMFSELRPYLTDQVLEIGSGIGNISEYLLSTQQHVTLSDLNQAYCHTLKLKFKHRPNLKAVIQMDVEAPQFETTYAEYLGQFACIIATNVVEHLKNDRQALQNLYRLLAPGGRLIILVPAYNGLFNRFDRELKHYRRYTRYTLSKLFRKSGLVVEKSSYFNLAGIPGWFIFGSLFKHKLIAPGLMSTYDKLVPVFKKLDQAASGSAGLSVYAVGRKNMS
jgi:SAM-dependent methyltransferase